LGLNIPRFMADNVIDQTPTPAATTGGMTPEVKAELDQQMQISLNGGIPPKAADAPAAAAGDGGQPVVITDPFNLLKEKFGYDTPETALKEIEELRAYKATPIVPEIKFENEENEKLFRAFTSGKKAEVFAFLEQEQKIDRLVSADLTNESAADLVKLGMQLKYKDLTAKEIDYKFNKQFSIPVKPVMQASEEQEEYDARVQQWEAQVQDKQMELMIEAKLAKPELLNAKQKLVFPEIEAQADPNYEQFLKELQQGDALAAEAAEAYKKITPETIETKIRFVDEPNKIDFEFQYKPTPEEFAKAVEVTMDESNLWKLFNNPDGTPNRQKFLRVINYALNEEKVLTQAINQGKNAALKSNLPDNSTGGLVRNLPPQTQEPNELDRLMRESLKGYGGF
jgi:hypothetical protein